MVGSRSHLACSSGSAASAWANVRPSHCPKSSSTRPGSVVTGRLSRSATAWAVCWQRASGEATMTVGMSSAVAMRWAARLACHSPNSVSGGLDRPEYWRRRDMVVCPWRSRSMRVALVVAPFQVVGAGVSAAVALLPAASVMGAAMTGVISAMSAISVTSSASSSRVRNPMGWPVAPASMARLARASAAAFWRRGTQVNSADWKVRRIFWHLMASSRMSGCLIFHRPDICSTTSLESMRTLMSVAPSCWAASSPL